MAHPNESAIKVYKHCPHCGKGSWVQKASNYRRYKARACRKCAQQFWQWQRFFINTLKELLVTS